MIGYDYYGGLFDPCGKEKAMVSSASNDFYLYGVFESDQLIDWTSMDDWLFLQTILPKVRPRNC